jgi:hypothetical protein
MRHASAGSTIRTTVTAIMIHGTTVHTMIHGITIPGTGDTEATGPDFR